MAITKESLVNALQQLGEREGEIVIDTSRLNKYSDELPCVLVLKAPIGKEVPMDSAWLALSAFVGFEFEIPVSDLLFISFGEEISKIVPPELLAKIDFSVADKVLCVLADTSETDDDKEIFMDNGGLRILRALAKSYKEPCVVRVADLQIQSELMPESFQDLTKASCLGPLWISVEVISEVDEGCFEETYRLCQLFTEEELQKVWDEINK